MSNSASISPGGVSLLLAREDIGNFSETFDSLEKTLDDIRQVIECRADIFMQKKEKRQQILDHQMMKLESKKNKYVNKSEAVMKEMGESKSQLMQIEHSYFNLRNKLNSEKQANKVLKDRVSQLVCDNKNKNAKFYHTSELYSTVINQYKNYLNIAVDLDKENFNIVKISFKETKKDFDNCPYIKLEILNDNKFKVLRIQPPMEIANNIMQEVIESHEVILLIHKFQTHLASH